VGPTGAGLEIGIATRIAIRAIRIGTTVTGMTAVEMTVEATATGVDRPARWFARSRRAPAPPGRR